MPHITLGLSPCPNDTFIFDALIHGKIDTGNLTVEPVLADVQTLNEWAIAGQLTASKISYGALHQLLPHYRLLSSGGALGFGVGPLLIGAALPAGNALADMAAVLQHLPVALPGQHTTAHHLFASAFPTAQHKRFLPFHQIEDFVASGQGLGVIIHENRFTYQQKGLQAWLDLGAFWEQNTGGPIPLGGIVLKKECPTGLAAQLDALIQNSLAYAWAHYPHLPPFVRQHAQEMSEDVMRQHINLYVNDYSHSLAETGKNAVLTLLAGQTNAARSAAEVFWLHGA